MTARSPQPRGAEWFTAPEQVNQRRYEALRAFYVEGLTHAEAAERYGYTRWGMVNLVREHRAGGLELFAPPRKPGPPPGGGVRSHRLGNGELGRRPRGGAPGAVRPATQARPAAGGGAGQRPRPGPGDRAASGRAVQVRDLPPP